MKLSDWLNTLLMPSNPYEYHRLVDKYGPYILVLLGSILVGIVMLHENYVILMSYNDSALYLDTGP